MHAVNILVTHVIRFHMSSSYVLFPGQTKSLVWQVKSSPKLKKVTSLTPSKILQSLLYLFFLEKREKVKYL